MGLRPFLVSHDHKFVTTVDKDGELSEFEKELVDADIVISQPFYPAYMTKERIEKAKNLKLIITAGVGSDHIDIAAAMDKKLTVAEITNASSVSVAEVRDCRPSFLVRL